tara:strand:+ start:1324 stop:1707 length:384 start_codon:yes stop_codon:yes gene_type:complete
MVKLRQGSNVLDRELNTYFDYDNNFSQLLEDYLLSGEIERKFNRSKCKSKAKFIYNQRANLTKKYKDGEDNKLMGKWMEDKYETKVAHIKRDQSKLIEELLTRVAKLETDISKQKEWIIRLNTHKPL